MEETVVNNIYELASNFALRIVKLYKYLTENKKEHIMSKQLLRAGTSIGANCFEGKNGHTRDDFAYKMSIALKKAGETGHKTSDSQHQISKKNRRYLVLTAFEETSNLKSQISNQYDGH